MITRFNSAHAVPKTFSMKCGDRSAGSCGRWMPRHCAPRRGGAPALRILVIQKLNRDFPFW